MPRDILTLLAPTGVWQFTSAPSEWGRNYGPTTDHDGRTQRTLTVNCWIPAITGSGATTIDTRSGGQGVASSNLASPTKRSTPSDLVGPEFNRRSCRLDADRRPLWTSYGPPCRKHCPGVQHGLHIRMQVASSDRPDPDGRRPCRMCADRCQRRPFRSERCAVGRGGPGPAARAQ